MKKDLTGQTFGMLAAIERREISKNGRIRIYYLCECSCKDSERNQILVREDSLVGGKTRSCGCLRATTQFKTKDITNMHFGYLKALYPTDKKSGTATMWHCICKCGKEIDVSIANLLARNTESCGCLRKELMREKQKKGYEVYSDKYLTHDTDLYKITRKETLKNNTSGVTGVSWDKERQKWFAQIVFQKKTYNLGRYNKLEDAAAARKLAEDNLFGNFLKWYEEEFKKSKSPEN